MRNVRCGRCKNYLEDGKCKIKKVKVAVAKKRTCDFYSLDESKVKERQVLPSRRVLPPELAKKHRYRARKAAKLEALKKQYFAKVDEKHPLTGDLDAFKTTIKEDSDD